MIGVLKVSIPQQMPQMASNTGRSEFPTDETAGSKRNQRIAISAAFGIFQRAMQFVSTLMLMPIVLRSLGPTRFGIWGAAVSLAWLAGFADIGTGSALVTLIARSKANKDGEAARTFVTGALTFGFLLTLILGSVGTIVSAFMPLEHQAGAYVIAAYGLAINVPLNTANNVWMALQKGYVASIWDLVQTALTLASICLVTWYSTDLRLYVAVVYGSLVLANTGSLIHLLLAHPELRPRYPFQLRVGIKQVASQGMTYFALGLIGSLSYLLDNVLALSLLGPAGSARMTIALRICVMALSTLVVVSQPLWPAFAEAAESGDRPWILRIFLRGSIMLIAITLMGAAVLATFGELLLSWWLPDSLGIDKALLWAINGWICAQALIRVQCLLLNSLSILRFQIAVSGAATLLAYLLKFGMSSHFGTAGILWGTTASVMAVFFPAVSWRVHKWFGDNAESRRTSRRVNVIVS